MSWYASDPTNDFADQIRGFLRGQGANSAYGPKSVPWLAVDLPLVTFLPNVAQDRDEVNLLDKTNKTVQRYVYVASIGQWVQVSAKTAVVTGLPTVAFEGMQIVYDTGIAGVRWQFVYDTSDGTTYPWLFIGGAPLYSETTNSNALNSATYVALANAGPAVTLPFAGDYDIRHGADIAAAAGIIVQMSYDIGGTGAVDADSCRAHGGAVQASVSRHRRKTFSVASTTLTAKYKESIATGSTVLERWLSATPVRVG